LTLKEFYSLSPKQFANFIEAMHLKKSKEFEHTRAICWYIAGSNRDPKKSFPSLQKFWPLPTDENTMKVLDEQRRKEIFEKYEQAKKIING
jgi:hypothetical protein